MKSHAKLLLSSIVIMILGACSKTPAADTNSLSIAEGEATLTPFLPTGPTNEPRVRGDEQHVVDAASQKANLIESLLGETFFLYNRQELSPIAEEIIRLTNEERQAQGVAALQGSEELDRWATLRAEDMIARDYLGPLDPVDGLPLAQVLLTAAGFEGRIAENVISVTGPADEVAAQVFAEWMRSDQNRQNLLDPNFFLTGIGIMGDGTWWKVSQLFTVQQP